MSSDVDYESSSVHAHLNTLQSIIDRMATSANGCKLWCTALISAVLVAISLGRVPEEPFPAGPILLALLPAVALLFLNAYYHGQELRFRVAYKGFVQKLEAGSARSQDLFRMPDNGGATKRWARSLLSFSIWPFYMMVGVVIALAWWVAA